jgi:two-component system LytT family response regulator
MALMSLKSLSESLPKHFLKVHRSFIINSDKIDSTTASQITIDGNDIPISEANRKWFKEWMAEKALN